LPDHLHAYLKISAGLAVTTGSVDAIPLIVKMNESIVFEHFVLLFGKVSQTNVTLDCRISKLGSFVVHDVIRYGFL